MTINTLENNIKSRFSDKTFSKCSYDDANSTSLVNSTIGLYDFDEICAELIIDIGGNVQTPMSLDSIYLDVPNKAHFIEFKNTKWSKVKKDDLKIKIYDSLALIISNYNLTIHDLNNIKIYLVHKTDPQGNPTHVRLNGTCPPQYRLIEETLGVIIVRYDANAFEKYINTYSRLP